ncbi:cAMP-binding domain of CRP or a regulatory subunit of cAMP-dependent protein kinases [Sphingomonas laterariae]|uniref:cAMP-binding domain of CRP or a regulatory subunit of cAMP-dependent protein kinases n=1 Tax=Edaphosphingomonas laterariae TaxID=861865 RepID=A0A239KJW6_9SPHN|nr:cAMP-binding domain of CRP or a regulatory subunit of cAMP-dependent protein kinases [Sphingomonas laterariae]
MALRVLRKAGWLKDYPAELAESLIAEGNLVRLNVGEWAQAEGDDRSGLFVVIEGVLHSYCAAPGDREVMIGLAKAGSVLGHATRFSGGPRLVTAVCVEPSILLEISEAALDRVAECRPEIWRAIAGFAYANMRSAVRMAAEVISLRPRERIAARLLAAADGHRETIMGPTPIIRLSQELLGEMTGLTRKTVNVHLSAFERNGLIEVGYGRIKLCDLERLRAVAND